MPRLLSGRFARRLALTFAALGACSALLTALLVNTAFSSRFQEYLHAQQRSQREQLLALFAYEYQHNHEWNRTSLNQLAPAVIMTGSEAQLLSPHGDRLWSLADAGTDAGTPEMHRAWMGTGDLGPPSTLPVIVDGQQVGNLVLRVPQSGVPTVDNAFRNSVNHLLSLGALAAALVALVAGAFIARRTTAPIHELTRAANDLAAGHRNRRVDHLSGDEFGQLATAFNTMAEQVESEDRLRRAFTADVAHELRTPLAILRSELEAVQDGLRQPSDQVIASLHEETLRLSTLVADLEALASADAAIFSLDRQPMSITKVITDTVASLAGRFDDCRITITTALDEVRVNADPVRVAQIVTNQLTNSLKFVREGGAVDITLREKDGWAELVVADTGTGIPADDLPHIFDRYYRSRSARADGSGIGLAVAAQLVAAHSGTISATSEFGHGATFITRLPTAIATPAVT